MSVYIALSVYYAYQFFDPTNEDPAIGEPVRARTRATDARNNLPFRFSSAASAPVRFRRFCLNSSSRSSAHSSALTWPPDLAPPDPTAPGRLERRLRNLGRNGRGQLA